MVRRSLVACCLQVAFVQVEPRQGQILSTAKPLEEAQREFPKDGRVWQMR